MSELPPIKVENHIWFWRNCPHIDADIKNEIPEYEAGITYSDIINLQLIKTQKELIEVLKGKCKK